MVITTYFDILVNNNNVKHYTKKGYNCVPGDNILVHWEHVPSYTDIKYKCDKCKNDYMSKKSTLLTQKHKGTCKSCSSRLSDYTSIKDISGQKFGKLTVINFHKNNPGKEKYWMCKCDCGNNKVISSRSLKTLKTTSCGCYRKEVIQNVIIPKLIEKNKKQIGDKHPNWDPTKSNKERYTIRKSEVNDLRKQAFERDKYTCQCCNKTNTVLNAHHILSFSQYPEDRYILENLITVCYICHKQYHSTYKKDINQETLNSFIKTKNV